jgi:nicotinamide mononucleotide (NMN) deamidase PncC
MPLAKNGGIMTTVSQNQLAQAVHDRGWRLVLAVTGGGSGAISALVGVPGASRSILAAAVPYSAEALAEWLGGKPDEFCSQRTARAMAMSAFLKARVYDPSAETCGVACTASLASDRPKRGPHRAHVAWQTATTTAACHLEFEKGRRTRAEEEALVTALVLNAVAEATGIDARLELALGASERVESRSVRADGAEQDLLAGRTSAIARGAAESDARPVAVLPGAFNPLHSGHRRMAAVAAQMLAARVAFEISITNVDKPPLDFLEIDERLGQFASDDAVWLTRAPVFVTKAELFPGATFVVGADTIERVGQPRYYGGETAMQQAIESIARSGCRFLVFGRVVEGAFRALGELSLPRSLAALCQEVPAAIFREDVSSTQLRGGRSTAP